MRKIFDAKYLRKVLRKIKQTTVIQRFVRGFLARRRVKRRRKLAKAAVILQRFYRKRMRGKYNLGLLNES